MYHGENGQKKNKGHPYGASKNLSTRTKIWKKLKEHFQAMKKRHLKDLFRREPRRFSTFSTPFDEILVDYSKDIITRETMCHLVELARECGLEEAVKQMFSGKKINKTENRAALHVAQRNRSNQLLFVNGPDVVPEINAVLKQG